MGVVMHVSVRFSRCLLAVFAVVGLSCSDSGGPDDDGPGDERPPAQLNILQLQPSSPALLNPVDSFYAKLGENREVRIFFADIEGGADEEYLRLSVDAQSLLTRPDGTPFATGDSILIHVSVVDPVQLLFEMQPSGLTFSPQHPARLAIRFSQCGDDFNQDGHVDGEDDTIEQELSIWRQETLTDPFIRLGGAQIGDREIEADLDGFSRYALAY
jgi:hypothetical protein